MQGRAGHFACAHGHACASRDVAEFVDGMQMIEGDPGFRSETVAAYEAGLRMQVGASLRLSASLFHNRYDDLRTVEWGDAPAQSGHDPRGHARLTSSMDLGRNQLLEISAWHVGRLPAPHLAAHTGLSVRYARRLSASLELSLRGVNLLRRHHREYPAREGRLIRRGAMIEARWSH